MANQNNNIGINDNDIQNAKNYADALDKLKTSINGINSKLPEFADGMQAGLKALGEQLPDVVDALTKLNAQNKELAASGQKPKSVLAELASSMLSWNSAISIGVTVLATYSGAIINWVSEMLKGKSTLSALGVVMRDNKIVMDALIQSRLNGDKNAQQELVNLKLLYTATQNHNLSLNERKTALGEIRAQYPDYLKNVSDDAVLAGKATKQYSNLSNAILASSRAREAENNLAKNRIGMLSNDDKLKKLLTQLENINKEINAAQSQHNAIEREPNPNQNPYGMGTDSKDPAGDVKLSRLKQQKEELQKIIADVGRDSKLLNMQNKALEKSVSDYTENFGVNVIDGLKQNIDSQKKIVKEFKKNTDNQKKIIDNYQKSIIVNSEKNQTDSLTKQLQDTTGSLAQKASLEHDSYTAEQAALQNLLDNKLISQEQYQQESQQLEEKYHLGIGDIVKQMNTDDLARMQQQQKDLLEAQQQNQVLSSDEQNINKAVMPGSKLNAEKQLITDKYNFEIQKAAETGQDTAAIRMQYEQEITDATNKSEEQRKDFAIQTAQEVSSAAFSIIGNSIKSSSDAKIKALENDKANELSNKNLTSTQKQAIDQKYKQQEDAVKLKAFKDEQKLSLGQALINGALAITKATSQTGVLAPFVIPAIIASTAIQVASILAQKPPAFAKGGHFVSDGRGAVLPGYSRTDNTNAYLRSGEAVVVSEAMRNPWARNLVSAINVAHGGRDFSVPNTGRGYAIGGIFTDGGNANRYYSQPVNDVKDLANTMAYQMINNFPPIYVDVKDVNNQQNILAQTINRVNL